MYETNGVADRVADIKSICCTVFFRSVLLVSSNPLPVLHPRVSFSCNPPVHQPYSNSQFELRHFKMTYYVIKTKININFVIIYYFVLKTPSNLPSTLLTSSIFLKYLVMEHINTSHQLSVWTAYLRYEGHTFSLPILLLYTSCVWEVEHWALY